MYHCTKCKHKHQKDSDIGKKHQKYKLEGKMYYCSECGHKHRISSEIGEKHFKFFEEKGKVKKKEKKDKKRDPVSQQSLDSVVGEHKEESLKKSTKTSTEISIDFEETKGKTKEKYLLVPHVESEIFDSPFSRELTLNEAKIENKRNIKINEIPPFILTKEEELIRKAKEKNLPLFAVEIITRKGDKFYELEVETYDLLLYKKR